MDTTGRFLQLAWNIDGEDGWFRDESPLRHSVTLMPRLAEILGERRTRALDCIGAVTGPGSFTGIRIGVSTVKAFAYANPELKVFAPNALRVKAADVEAKGGDVVVAAADGGNKIYYVAVYSGEHELLPPSALTLPRLEAFLDTIDEPSILTGDIDGAASPANMQRAVFASDRTGLFLIMNRAVAAGDFIDYRALEPLYVQIPQAEKDLLKK
jgi:tRNA threonylcarbamoyladenosine biosynthesis protein TsaB